MKILDIITESHHKCPHCSGPLVSESELMEKKDACYYKIKSSAKVWPSAYASGRLVQCRKKGAANYGNKSEGVAEGSEQKPAITYKDYTLQYDYQTEDDDPEGYSTATTYYFDVLKDGDRVGEAEYFDYFGNLTIRINGKTKEFGFRHPLASQISQLVSSLPDEQKKDLSDPRFESQGVAEGENWSKHNNKRAGGMSKKSVASYRRSHPGSKIQTAVTTKPSKLKKGSKSAKRRASFCARMKGMKKHRTGAKTARDPNSNINKSLRRWHCESIEELQELVMLAEQFIRNNKK